MAADLLAGMVWHKNISSRHLLSTESEENINFVSVFLWQTAEQKFNLR